MVHSYCTCEALGMTRAAARSDGPPARSRPPRFRMAGWLPQGRALTPLDFAWRHRIVCTLLALHLPAIMIITVLTGRTALHGLVEVAPVVVLLGVALAPVSRRSQALAASLGLVTCSAVLVHL